MRSYCLRIERAKTWNHLHPQCYTTKFGWIQKPHYHAPAPPPPPHPTHHPAPLLCAFHMAAAEFHVHFRLIGYSDRGWGIICLLLGRFPWQHALKRLAMETIQRRQSEQVAEVTVGHMVTSRPQKPTSDKKLWTGSFKPQERQIFSSFAFYKAFNRQEDAGLISVDLGLSLMDRMCVH